jgi:hypothetical protein
MSRAKNKKTNAAAKAEAWMAARRHVRVASPSQEEQQAAFDHLFARAKAQYEASLIAEQQRRATLKRPRGARRTDDDREGHLALVKVLREAGRLSWEEYVFMGGHCAHWVNDERWFKGDYDAALRPIADAMDQIEREAGLVEGEFWLKADAPPE